MRRLAVVPAVLLLAMALVGPSTAFAAEPTTTGYNQEPKKPSTGTSPSKETSTGTSPSKETSTGTSPSKESSTPTTSTSKEAAPSTSSATPTSQKASTLPFTGFDLRWSIGAGVLLMGAGFSIVAAQRRQRRESGR
jgi:cytoskeletal protein RodZ